VIVGGGHNALVAATLLARAGRSVLLLERNGSLGGAAASASPFPGVDVAISRYAYLVSLFPQALLDELGVAVELRPRRVASCTPDGDRGLLVGGDAEATRRSFAEVTGSPADYEAWLAWHRLTASLAAAVAPTLLGPLPAADEVRRRAGEEAWSVLVERPLGTSLRQFFGSDLVRGLVCTDGLIGTLAHSEESSLRQNRCLLYHVVGNGHGRWDVPVGGMGALSGALAAAARAAGAELRTGAEVESIDTDGRCAEVRTSDGGRHRARVVLCGAAPAVLDRLLGRPSVAPPEGAQLKCNLVVTRLPRLACGIEPADAFCGTLHVNERLTQLDAAFATATSGARLPDPVPCEVYCHTLTDPSILGPNDRNPGLQTLTAFALHTPARLFRAAPAAGQRQALEGLLASLQSVLAEPLEDCVARSPGGEPCIELHTPLDLEDELAMPGGHIFHRDLDWPWAERDDEVGTWGAGTGIANVMLCGSGTRRGGAVSGLGGHDGARAALAALDAAAGGAA
jgi:phytoene dehydrogenase-like protein